MTNLDEFFAEYRKAWSDNSAARIESFWDTSQPPLYKAEEIPRMFNDWDELRAYWQHNETFNSINELSYSDRLVQEVSENVLQIAMRMRWDIYFGADVRNMDGKAFAWAGQAMGGDNHVMACLKKVSGEWKICSWVEAPDAPIIYMAELYRRNVRPDFPAGKKTS